MKKIIKLTESDLTRIVKRVIKEDVDAMDKLDELDNHLQIVLKVMDEFCQKAYDIYQIDIPDDGSIESEELMSKVAFIEQMSMTFQQILDEYLF